MTLDPIHQFSKTRLYASRTGRPLAPLGGGKAANALTQPEVTHPSTGNMVSSVNAMGMKAATHRMALATRPRVHAGLRERDKMAWDPDLLGATRPAPTR